MMTDRDNARGQVEDDPITHGAYGPGVLDEVTVPPTDPVREAKDRDLDDPAHVRVDPEVLRNGGPTRSPGAMTTTGGTAGPASIRRPTNRDRSGSGKGDDENVRIAPTTTGDATSGGMATPAGGSSSDATTGAEST